LWSPLNLLLQHLPRLEQKTFFYALLRRVSKTHLNSSETFTAENDPINGVAAIVSGIIKENDNLEACLVEWLTATTGDAFALKLEARRAMIAALSEQEGSLSGSSTSFRADHSRTSAICIGQEPG
jgi:hypothetical protein